MPLLRSKVAVEMGTEVDSLKQEEIKSIMLATFQDFLLNEANLEEEDEVVAEDLDVVEEPIKKKSKTSTKSGKAVTKTKSKTEKVNSTPKTSKSLKEIKLSPSSSSTTSSPTASKKSSSSDAQIERLKSYIFKCGVRKVW
jgi:hypothetical protein